MIHFLGSILIVAMLELLIKVCIIEFINRGTYALYKTFKEGCVKQCFEAFVYICTRAQIY